MLISKNRIVLIIGVILVLIPLLGFTTSWKHFFFIVSGAILILMSFSNSISRRSKVQTTKKARKNQNSEVFVDGHGTYVSDKKTTKEVKKEELGDTAVQDSLTIDGDLQADDDSTENLPS